MIVQHKNFSLFDYIYVRISFHDEAKFRIDRALTRKTSNKKRVIKDILEEIDEKNSYAPR